MSISQIVIGSPALETLFSDTNLGNTVDAVKGSSAIIYWVTVNNSGNASNTYVRMWNTAAGSVVNGTTQADQVLFCPAGAVQTYFFQTSGFPGLTFGTALSIAANTNPFTSTSSPVSPVTVTLAYQ